MFFAFTGIAAGQFHGYLFELKGSGAMAIGFLLMAGYLSAVAAPILQVQIIRRFSGPYLPFIGVSSGACIALVLMPHAKGFIGLLLLFSLLNFCVASIFPLLTAATLESTRTRGHAIFVRIRGLGTVGFLAASVACLAFPRSEKLPWLYAGFGLGFLLSMASLLPAARRHAREQSLHPKHRPPAPNLAKAWRRLAKGETSVMLVLLAAMNFANVMATAVQGNYLIHRFHLDQRSINLAWVVSTVFEIAWMFLCARILPILDIRRVIVVGLWGTVIKLGLLAWAESYFTFLFGLAFHGFFFSFTLTGFGVYLDKRFRPSERPAQQALTSALVQSIPAAMAGLLGGLLWHSLGLRSVYVFSALMAAITCIGAELWSWRHRVYFRPQGDR